MAVLVLATHNPGKVAELAILLEPLGYDIVSSDSLGMPAPAETGATFVENATLKALAVREHPLTPQNAWVLADDSGLCVRALGGLPGVRTSEYGGFVKLLAEMEGLTDRSAFFVCVLVLLSPDGTKHIVEGRVDGRISAEIRGAGGFGYDPVFIPEKQDLTFAEMGKEAKNAVSHRGRALRNLLNILVNV